jgi:hypothetical protein
MTLSIENKVSKKKIIIGMLIMTGIGLAVSFFIPFPFSLLFSFVIGIFVFSKYWSRPKLRITVLLLILMAKDLILYFLLPFPFSLIPLYIIGYFIIDLWLNPKKKV